MTTQPNASDVEKVEKILGDPAMWAMEFYEPIKKEFLGYLSYVRIKEAKRYEKLVDCLQAYSSLFEVGVAAGNYIGPHKMTKDWECYKEGINALKSIGTDVDSSEGKGEA